MDDLTAFITKRLDEDERYLKSNSHHLWTERPLREVAAKRAITALHYPEWTDYVDGDGIERASRECAECEPPGTPDNWPCPTMRALAAVWSDHPDYRPEWAPLTPAVP